MNRLLFLLILLIASSGHSQDTPRKSLKIERTNTPPKIDGVLDDVVWEIFGGGEWKSGS